VRAPALQGTPADEHEVEDGDDENEKAHPRPQVVVVAHGIDMLDTAKNTAPSMATCRPCQRFFAATSPAYTMPYGHTP
jgi:3-mercaptopyruvate sulfurtransferase SseA